jgi:hypothetical protein
MANEVFIVQCRNDLPDGLVQYTDVSPNTSQRNASIDPAGQTGYIDAGQVRDTDNAFHWRLEPGDQPPLTSAAGAVSIGTTGVDGLIAWLMWHIECQGGGGASSMLSVRQATACAWGIINRVVAGQSLLVGDLTTLINVRGAAVGGLNVDGALPEADPALSAGDIAGTGAIGTNTGKTNEELVEEVMRLVAGDTFRILATTEVTANNGGSMNWAGVDHSLTAGAAFLTAPNTNTTAAQTFPRSTDFRERRRTFLSGSIRSSAQVGKLSIYKRTQDIVVGGNTGFGYTAARLPSGQVATYGGGDAIRFAGGGTAPGTARGLSAVAAITGIAADNNATVTTATEHGLIVGDVVRVRGVINGAGGQVTLNVQVAVAAGGFTATTFELTAVDNTVGNNGAASVANSGTVNLSQAGADHINIPSSGVADKQFRGVMVYDSTGAIL